MMPFKNLKETRHLLKGAPESFFFVFFLAVFWLFLSGQRREALGVKLSAACAVPRHRGPAPSASSLAVLAPTPCAFLWSFFPHSRFVLFSSQKIICLFPPLFLLGEAGKGGRGGLLGLPSPSPGSRSSPLALEQRNVLTSQGI